MDIKSDSGKVSGIKGESFRESLYHLREYMYHHKHVGRNINIKGHSGKVLDDNEVTGNCRKVNPCPPLAQGGQAKK